MKRRDLLQLSAGIGLTASLTRSALAVVKMDAPESFASGSESINPLKPPATGRIPVAFLLSEGAVVIDFAGPWEVFEDVSVPGGRSDPFQLYTVAENTNPIHTSGGMTIVPNYSLATAPAPRIIVVPAQSDPTVGVISWLRAASRTTDVTMSVCTGAFVLAKAGLLSGKSATTHHAAYKQLAAQFPDIHVKRGARFVEQGNIASSGGLSSGIDLALHVVERYFGRDVATRTAYDLEYQGTGWMNAESNQAYALASQSTDHPQCPICQMDVDQSTAPSSNYHGRTYFFCMNDHKVEFDAAPESYAVG